MQRESSGPEELVNTTAEVPPTWAGRAGALFGVLAYLQDHSGLFSAFCLSLWPPNRRSQQEQRDITTPTQPPCSELLLQSANASGPIRACWAPTGFQKPPGHIGPTQRSVYMRPLLVKQRRDCTKKTRGLLELLGNVRILQGQRVWLVQLFISSPTSIGQAGWGGEQGYLASLQGGWSSFWLKQGKQPGTTGHYYVYLGSLPGIALAQQPRPQMPQAATQLLQACPTNLVHTGPTSIRPLLQD